MPTGVLHICRSDAGVLFYSIRPSAGPAVPLAGQGLEDDLPNQAVDEELLGQIDGVDSGEVTGWACHRGYMARPLEVTRLHPPPATKKTQPATRPACMSALHAKTRGVLLH
jgi:hypothetical protein